MVLVKSVNYDVRASYFISAETKVGNVDFSKSIEKETPSETLEIVKNWQHPNINLALSRTIYFHRRDGFISHAPPINEDLTIEQLEKLVSEGENLPNKQYDVSISVEEARARCALVEAVTGKLARWVIE